MTEQDLIATEYQPRALFYIPDMSGRDIKFCRMRSPFYSGEKWAVRYFGLCLNKESQWEFEPLPSSRTDAFYKDFRFDSLQEAIDAFNNAVPSTP